MIAFDDDDVWYQRTNIEPRTPQKSAENERTICIKRDRGIYAGGEGQC